MKVKTKILKEFLAKFKIQDFIHNSVTFKCPSGEHLIYTMQKTSTCRHIIIQLWQLNNDIAMINKLNIQILVTVTQSVTNVPQTNNTSTSGMNEE